MEEYAIIVAGGTGKRMGLSTPKQFLILAGRPVLAHTLDAFYSYSTTLKIILTLPSQEIDRWQHLVRQYSIDVPHKVVQGGPSRFQSVKNGLSQVGSQNAVVAIHDGVRPLIDVNTIALCMETASVHGSAIVTVPLKESIRRLQGSKSHGLDRSDFVLVQTPQVFKHALIQKAYDVPESPDITDDATVAERAGVRIQLVRGSYDNIKITTPDDLAMAEAIMKMKNKKAGSA